eukprot:4763377-Pyramimonas_sp.AAC.1
MGSSCAEARAQRTRGGPVLPRREGEEGGRPRPDGLDVGAQVLARGAGERGPQCWRQTWDCAEGRGRAR